MKKTVLLIVILLFIVFTGFFYLGSLFTDKFVEEKIEELETSALPFADSTYTDLTGQPFSLRRYFSSSIKESPGLPLLAKVYISGDFKTDEKSDWMPFSAENYYCISSPEFVTDATIKTNSFTWIRSIESLTEGRGNLLIKFLSSLTISDVQSDELDQSYLIKYLCEAVFFPESLKPSDNLTWKKINNEILLATYKQKQLSVTAKFHINRDNEVFKITTTDKYKTGKTGYQKLPSTILYSDYKWFGNYRIPTRSEVQWNFPDSSFTYGRFIITNVEYTGRPIE